MRIGLAILFILNVSYANNSYNEYLNQFSQAQDLIGEDDFRGKAFLGNCYTEGYPNKSRRMILLPIKNKESLKLGMIYKYDLSKKEYRKKRIRKSRYKYWIRNLKNSNAFGEILFSDIEINQQCIQDCFHLIRKNGSNFLIKSKFWHTNASCRFDEMIRIPSY